MNPTFGKMNRPQRENALRFPQRTQRLCVQLLVSAAVELLNEKLLFACVKNHF